ncbi:MAG: hypothetical protein C4586_08285 [Anaerolineaceae bacterium]|nr:MAG: hypothetical protein C4586_08285 [Anaerolineaceae bacterium]
MTIKFTKWAGIKDEGDVTSTKPPYLREGNNVDVDDEGKRVSRREGFGAPIIAGDYHSLWSNAARDLMLGVTGGTLVSIDPQNISMPTIIIRSGLTVGAQMSFDEINNQISYSNGYVLGIIEHNTGGTLPTVSKMASSTMPAGQIVDFYDDRLYTIQGGRVAYSEALDFGRAVPRSAFFWFPGQITMWKSVADGIYASWRNQTVFIRGKKPSEFAVEEVADYAAIPYTSLKFDASLVSSKVPLQGKAVFWMSQKGPCIGFAGGMMLNLALTKVVPQEGITGASVLRKNRKGFYQAISVIQE